MGSGKEEERRIKKRRGKMLTVRQKKYLKKKLCPERERKKRIWRLKGWPEITLPTRHYSLEERGDFIYLLRDREEISHFCKGVAAETIERYASGYEFDLQRKEKERERKMTLKEYCEASFSHCKAANWDCNKCESNYKEWALERKKEGKKVVRPGRKKEEFMEAIQERNALLKQEALKNKKISPRQSFSGGWR